MCGWKGDLRQSCPLFVSGLGKLATRSKDKITNKTKVYNLIITHALKI